MFRIKILAAVIFLCGAPAFGQQTVKQSGVITPGHGVKWVTTGVIADNGLPSTGGIGLTGIVITPIPGTTNQGIAVNQGSPSGGAGTPVVLNFWNIGTTVPENINAGPNFMTAVQIDHHYGGGLGGRETLAVYGTLESPSSALNTNHDYVGISSSVVSKVNDGGTSGTTVGHLYAYGGQAILKSGATFYDEVTWAEANIAVQAGASVKYKAAFTIAALSSDAVQGSVYDASLMISNEGGAIGFQCGVCFSGANGSQPVTSTGTMIATIGSKMVATGIDFSSYTFSSNFLKSAGFAVDGSGRLQLAAAGSSLSPTEAYTNCGTGCGWFAPAANQLVLVIGSVVKFDYGNTTSNRFTMNANTNFNGNSIFQVATLNLNGGPIITGAGGALALQTAATTALSIDTSQNVSLASAGSSTTPTLAFTTCGTNCGFFAPTSGQLVGVIGGVVKVDYGNTTASRWTFNANTNFNGNSIFQVATLNLNGGPIVSGAGGILALQTGAAVTAISVDASQNINLPVVPTGTPAASLCLDSGGNVIKKTTTGPCI